MNSIYHNTLYSFHVINRGYDINRGHYLKRVVINIRASKNISGLVKVSVTSPAGLMKFFLNVEPCKSKGSAAIFFLHFRNLLLQSCTLFFESIRHIKCLILLWNTLNSMLNSAFRYLICMTFVYE